MRRVERLLAVTIAVANPVFACTDLERFLLAELRQQYVGHCFKGCYITDIVRIAARSACRIETTNGRGEGSVDVQFLAGAAVFAPGDLLAGVRLIVASALTVGQYSDAEAEAAGRAPARAAVTLLAAPATRALAVGQAVAVRVVALSSSGFPNTGADSLTQSLAQCRSTFTAAGYTATITTAKVCLSGTIVYNSASFVSYFVAQKSLSPATLTA